MLKSALRLSHTTSVLDDINFSNAIYEKQKIEGKLIDGKKFNMCTFKHFVFSDCGMKNVIFEDCKFIDCIFAGCYMKHAHFVDCTINGCHFEICITTGIRLERTRIEYVNFFRCILPYRELTNSLGGNHSSNDKILLNCAAEAHRIGAWREAELFVSAHLVEKRRFWWKVVFSKDSYYRNHGGFLYKFRSLLRYLVSRSMSLIFGDSASIFRMALIGLFAVFFIGPLSAFLSDSTVEKFVSIPDYLEPPVQFFKYYKSYFISFVNLMIGSTLQSTFQPEISNKELFEVVSRVFGIVYLSVFANALTKSIGVGPRW